MTESGWRTVRIAAHAEVGISENMLHVSREEDTDVPLAQIRSLIVETQDVSISSRALTLLTQAHVQILFCDEKHNPVCECTPFHQHTQFSGHLKRQAAWEQEVKDRLWQEIVRQKLRGQQALMETVSPGSGACIDGYLSALTPGDRNNCEATAAGMHFRTLFGYTFSRGKDCTVNAALNYGYAILLSNVNRALSIYGYRSELGVHHCSDMNPFNLSCDLMEPFRPLIDAVVLSLDTDEVEELTFEARTALIGWQYREIRLGGYRCTAGNAIELFVKDCLDYMNGEKELSDVREVSLLA